MYRKDLLKDSASSHFHDCVSYLDCPLQPIIVSESNLREKFDPKFMDKLLLIKGKMRAKGERKANNERIKVVENG
jgi:hypothetical protein